MKLNLLKAILPTVLVLTLFSCSPESEILQETETTEALTPSYTYNESELELIDKINEHRQSIGLNVLETINYISVKSQEHNDYMIAANAINHDYFQERSQDIIDMLGATKVSENVAYNFSTADAVLNAWLSSEGHRVNIEGDFSHFGISIIENPINGKKYYTNIFMKK